MKEEKINEQAEDLPKEEEFTQDEVSAAAKIDKRAFDKGSWKPRTSLGRKVKNGEITSIGEILDNRYRIMEREIVDILLPGLKTDLLLVGQAKGKFGGGQRRVFRQTQKKTQEGNKPHFGTFALVGNEDGYVGIGYGKSKETVPAREKAIRNSKQNIIKVLRGCGSWRCGCKNPHSVPFVVEGKCGSVKIRLIPAPRGTGLSIEKECGKMLKAAGIKDVWCKTSGKTGTKANLIYACFDALKKLTEVKFQQKDEESLGIVEGPVSAN
ncbi:MAG: 30S ribosomal protein S5 [Nanoarchaeota archaeon]